MQYSSVEVHKSQTAANFFRAALSLVLLCVSGVGVASAQHDMMDMGPTTSGLPHNIPEFCLAANIRSVRDGAWSDPGTWSPARVPGAGDIAMVVAGTNVTYDTVSDAALNCLGVYGRLQFRTDINTRLTVGTMMVMSAATLVVGDVNTPVASNVTAEIVIADQALNTSADPEQYGTGLIGIGTVTMHGAIKNSTFVRLTSEVSAGAANLSLSASPTGWQPGDRLVIPDSRHLRDNERDDQYVPQWEVKTLGGISGSTASLSATTSYSHPGARNADGVLEFLPHVGNLTRNVVIRSQNPNGTRGHVIFVARAAVDIRYTAFLDLGRTTISVLDSTTFDSGGNVTHIGTNEIGRYAIHFHHLMGPTTPLAGGYQYNLIGNAFERSSKWSIAIHDTHYGRVSDNVVFRPSGVGVMTEDGSESYNLIEHNFVVATTGVHTWAIDRGYNSPREFGFEGSSFWFRGGHNYVRNNVAAGATSYGFTIAQWFLDPVQVPTSQGAATTTAMDMTATPILEFSGNEAYGALDSALTLWWIGTYYNTPNVSVADSTIANFRAWNYCRYGFYGYQTNNVVFDGFVARGDVNVLSNALDGGLGLWFGDYLTRNMLITHADIQNLRTGIYAPIFTDGVTPNFIENSTLKNYTNIVDVTAYNAAGGSFIHPRTLVIHNVQYGRVAQSAHGGQPQTNIQMGYQPADNANLIQLDRVYVFDHNGAVGDNFGTFYTQQAAGFVVPQTSADGERVGAPVAGLTNAQTWAQYGIAIAGAVTPCTNTRADVQGYVCAVGVQLITRNGNQNTQNGQSRVIMAIEAPTGGHVTLPFVVSGYALDTGAATSSGVDGVNLWASPLDGSPAIFIGAATMGARPDVAAIWGSRFLQSGFTVVVNSLPAGAYRLVAYPHSTVLGGFAGGQTVDVNLGGNPRMSIDIPRSGEHYPGLLIIAGWGINLDSATGAGVDRVEIWGDHPGDASRQLGTASFGSARPDIGAAFGSRFTNCGWGFTVNGIAAGNWTLSAKLYGPGNQLLMTQQVTVVIEDGLRLNVDSPASGSVLSPGTQVLSGWALDVGAASGTGIAALHVWAVPSSGQAAIFLGYATLGGYRPDVAQAFGSQFPNAGFTLPFSLPSGAYDIITYALRTRTNTFDAAQVVHVTIQGSRVLAMIDAPAVNATLTSGSLTVAGWAIDPDSQAGSGIPGVDVWAVRTDTGTATFLGHVTASDSRPDVGAAFGTRYTNSGFHLTVARPAPGPYNIVIYPFRASTGQFEGAQAIPVTIR